MKRFLAMMLVLVLALSLVACGQPKATEEQTDWGYIQEKGKLTIGVTNYPPMNYLDDNGEWTGFDTEFAQAVGKKLGVDVEFVGAVVAGFFAAGFAAGFAFGSAAGSYTLSTFQ